MDNVHVITYATKSFGMFDELVNNKYNVPVTVLGMGKKWYGFRDKITAYRDYMADLPPDDIVVVVDGFDTKINGRLETAVEIFKRKNVPILVSKDTIPFYREWYIKKIFGTYDNVNTANSGLFMGYAKNLYPMLNEISFMKCGDDQRNMNTVCAKHEVSIDTEREIFHNLCKEYRKNKSDAIFIGYPGSMSWNRVTRGMREYPQFFYKEIVVLLILLSIAFPRLWLINSIIILILSFYCDISCI